MTVNHLEHECHNSPPDAHSVLHIVWSVLLHCLKHLDPTSWICSMVFLCLGLDRRTSQAHCCLQASNLAPRTPATGGPSIASMTTPVSSSSSDLSSAGRTSSGKKAPKQRKGGLSMFLAGAQVSEILWSLDHGRKVSYCMEKLPLYIHQQRYGPC